MADKSKANGTPKAGTMAFNVNDDGTFTITGKLHSIDSAPESKSGKSLLACASSGFTLLAAHDNVITKANVTIIYPKG